MSGLIAQTVTSVLERIQAPWSKLDRQMGSVRSWLDAIEFKADRVPATGPSSESVRVDDKENQETAVVLDRYTIQTHLFLLTELNDDLTQGSSRLDSCDQLLAELQSLLELLPPVTALFVELNPESDCTKPDQEAHDRFEQLQCEQTALHHRQIALDARQKTALETLQSELDRILIEENRREVWAERIRQLEHALTCGPPTELEWNGTEAELIQRYSIGTTTEHAQLPAHEEFGNTVDQMISAQTKLNSSYEEFLKERTEELEALRTEAGTDATPGSDQFPSSDLDSLQHVDGLLKKLQDWCAWNAKSLHVLQSVHDAWEHWQRWWSDSGAVKLLTHGGPCGLVQYELQSFDHTSDLSATLIPKLTELQTDLNRLAQQAQSNGQAALDRLTRMSTELQTVLDEQHRWSGPEWGTATGNKLAHTPLSIGLLACQLLVREAHSQWSFGFDDLGLAQQRVHARLTSLNAFLSDRENLHTRLTHIEEQLNQIEPRLVLPQEISQTPVDWNQATDSTWPEREMPHWPCPVESVISASLDGQIKLSAAARQLKKDAQSVGERLFCLQRTVHSLGLDEAPVSDATLPAHSNILASLTSQHAALVKRTDHVVQRLEQAVRSHHQLAESWHVMTEWIGQLQQSLAHYTSLSGDRHMLQARLELIKDLHSIASEGNVKWTEIKRCVEYNLQHGLIPVQEELTKLSEIAESFNLAQVRAAILFHSFEIHARWMDAQNQIQTVMDQLGTGIETWQLFEYTRDRCVASMNRLESWLKSQTNSVIHSKEDIVDRLEVFKSVTGCLALIPENSQDSIAQVEITQVDDHDDDDDDVDDQTMSPNQLATETRQLANQLHLTLRKLPKVADEVPSGLGDLDEASQVQMMDAFTLSTVRVNEIYARIARLQKTLAELSTVWQNRLSELTNWDDSVHMAEDNLLLIAHRVEQIRTQITAHLTDLDTDMAETTLEDALIQLDDLNSELARLSTELSEAQNKLHTLIPCLTERGRRAMTERLDQLQQDWTRQSHSIEQCRTELVQRQTTWSTLSGQLEMLIEWITKQTTNLSQLQHSIPLQPQSDSVLLTDGATKSSPGLSLAMQCNARAVESQAFCEQARQFVRTVNAKYPKVEQLTRAIQALNETVLVSNLDAAIATSLDQTTEQFHQLQQQALALFAESRGLSDLCSEFARIYGEVWKELAQLQNQFAHGAMFTVDSDADRGSTQPEHSCVLDSTALEQWSRQLGTKAQLEELIAHGSFKQPIQSAAESQRTIAERVDGLRITATKLDTFKFESVQLPYLAEPRTDATRAVQFLLIQLSQLAKTCQTRLDRLRVEQNTVNEVDQLFERVDSELDRFEGELSEIQSVDRPTDEPSVTDACVHWNLIDSWMNFCQSRESRLRDASPQLVALKPTLDKLQLIIGQLLEGTNRVYFHLNQHLVRVKSKYENLTVRSRRLQTQLGEEYKAWDHFVTCFREAEDWITLDESAVDRIWSDDAPQLDGTPANEDGKCKPMNDNYEEIVQCLDRLEQIENNLCEKGRVARDAVEQSVQNLMLSRVIQPGAKSFDSGRSSSFDVRPLTLALEHFYARWDRHTTRLQHIRAELGQQLLSQSQLDTTFDRAQRWFQGLVLQLDATEQDTGTSFSNLIGSILMPLGDLDQILAYLSGWISPKSHTWDTLHAEVEHFLQIEMPQLEQVIQQHAKAEHLARTRLNRTSASVDVTDGSASGPERLMTFTKQVRDFEQCLERKRVSWNRLVTQCEKFAQTRAELITWLNSEQQKVQALVASMERCTRPTVMDLRKGHRLSGCTEQMQLKLAQIERLTETMRKQSDRKLNELQTIVTTLFQSAVHPSGTTIDLLEKFSSDQLTDTARKQVHHSLDCMTDLISQTQAWITRWSELAVTVDELSQWLTERENSLAESIAAEIRSEVYASTVHLTGLDDVRRLVERVHDQVRFGQEFRVELVSKQASVEALLVSARNLVTSGSFPPKQAAAMEQQETRAPLVTSLAVTQATQLMQRYQTLLSLIDRRTQLNYTASRTVEQLLAACETYKTWAEELDTQLKLTTRQLNPQTASADADVTNDSDETGDGIATSVPALDLDTIRKSASTLSNRLESGASLVQLCRDWTDRFVAELALQRGQRRAEQETLQHFRGVTSPTVTAVSTTSQPKVRLFVISDYETWSNAVRSVQERTDKLHKKASSHNLAHMQLLSWLSSASSQIDAIVQHASPTSIAVTIAQQFTEFEKSMELIEQQTTEAVDKLTQMASDCMIREHQINRLEDVGGPGGRVDIANIKDRFMQMVNHLHESRTELCARIHKVHAFQSASMAFSAWLVEIESRVDSLVSEDGLLVSSNVHSRTRAMNASTDLTLDSPGRTTYRVTHIADAERRLVIFQNLGEALHGRGRLLAKRTSDSGEQLIANLRLAEENVELDQSVSTMDSCLQLSVLIQDHVEELQSRMARLEQTQAEEINGLTELLSVWNECLDHIDQLTVWVQETQTTVRQLLQRQSGNTKTRKQAAVDFENVMDQLRESAELHVQYDQTVGQTNEWLTRIADRLNACLCPNEAISQAEMERRIAAGRVLTEVLTRETKAYLDPLVTLSDRIVQSADNVSTTLVYDKLDGFRQTIRELQQQLVNAGNTLEMRLNRCTKWTNAKTDVNVVLEGLAQEIVQVISSEASVVADENGAPLSSARLMATKQAYIDSLKTVRHRLEDVSPKLEQMKRAAKDLVQSQAQQTAMKEVDELASRHAKMLQEVEIRIGKNEHVWHKLYNFHTKLSEAEGWILSLSLKLMAIHITEPDGPQGVIRLGRAHAALRQQFETFRAITVTELKEMAQACYTELRSSAEFDQAAQMGRDVIGTNTAEQVANFVRDAQTGSNSTTNQPAQLTHSNPLLGEVVQLEANCDSVNETSEQIKMRLLDQQERWAHFVAVLGRVSDHLREELTAWWRNRPQRVWSTKHSRTRSRRSKRLSYTSSDESGCESLHSSVQQKPVPGLSHPREIATQTAEAEAANARIMLKQYVRDLNELKIRWDQQHICEAEFDAWLTSKEADVRDAISQRSHRRRHHSSSQRTSDERASGTYERLIHAMDTAHLETIQNELRAKGSVLTNLRMQRLELIGGGDRTATGDMGPLGAIESRLKALLTRVEEALTTRRELISQAIEATRLTDNLHEDLHNVVRRSTGLDMVECSPRTTTGRSNLKSQIGYSQKPFKPPVERLKSSKRPVFWTSSTHLAEHLHDTNLSRTRSPFTSHVTIPTCLSPPTVSTRPRLNQLSAAQSVPNLHASETRALESYFPDTLDWLWFSPNTLLAEAGGVGTNAEPSPDLPVIRADLEGEEPEPTVEQQLRSQTPSIRPARDEPGALDKSRSSSRNSLVFGRPWRMHRTTKRGTAFGDSNLSASALVLPTRSEVPTTTTTTAATMLDQVNTHQSFERLPTQRLRSDSPYPTQTMLSHGLSIGGSSQAEIPLAMAFPDTPAFPLLLRRSISPVLSRAHRPTVRYVDSYSGTDLSQTVATSSRRQSGFGFSAYGASQPLDSIAGPLGPMLLSSSTTVLPTRSLMRHTQAASRSGTPRFDLSSDGWTSGLGSRASQMRLSGVRGTERIASPALSELETIFHTGRPQPAGASISDSIVTQVGKPLGPQHPLTSRAYRYRLGTSTPLIPTVMETISSDSPGRSEIRAFDALTSRAESPAAEYSTSITDSTTRTSTTTTTATSSTATTYHLPRPIQTPAQLALERYRSRKRNPSGTQHTGD
ncbi:unnamed protein product [Echinostoma caproni]|uniref:GAR domain-containing protein n=1 Tax=Echinostoma caproni TaxID=27848 RepID=A0A183AK60_9TREM|nr:unnamed protein product [Echinostoma caproni]